MNNKTLTALIVILIIGAASFVRFYNYPNRINYGPEQALSLTVSADYLKTKFSLLGLPSVQRKTSQGHTIYFGALFNYSLTPLLIAFNYDPLAVTVFSTILNIVTGLVIFFVIRRLFDEKTAIFTMILFLFNEYMIYHSMFIWIVNYMPLIGITTLWCFWQYKKTGKERYILFSGVLTGAGFNLEYMYLFTAVLVGLYLLFSSRHKLIDSAYFILGALLSNLTLVIFEFKNDFYHLRTLVQYTLDTIHYPGQSNFAYYHWLQFWPVACLMGSLFLVYVYRKNKFAAGALIGLYIIANLISPKVSFSKAIGMKDGTSYPVIVKAAQAIASDRPENFNVATLVDFNFPGYTLRYLLKYRYHLNPKDTGEYKNIDRLYVLGPSDYQFSYDSPWEVTAMGDTDKTVLVKLNNDMNVFKLTKKK